MTDEEYKKNLETEVKNILLEKLKEMAEVKPDDYAYSCGSNEYAVTCSAMSDMAKIILGIA